MLGGLELFFLMAGMIGVPILIYWIVVGIWALKQDTSDRTSHEASTVQAEFQKGKNKELQERQHRSTVRLLYLQNAYQFFAYTSFNFMPGIPYFWDAGVTDALSAIRASLFGFTSYIMFSILFIIYVICGFLFLRNSPDATKKLWDDFIARRRRKYAAVGVEPGQGRDRQSSTGSNLVGDRISSSPKKRHRITSTSDAASISNSSVATSAAAAADKSEKGSIDGTRLDHFDRSRLDDDLDAPYSEDEGDGDGDEENTSVSVHGSSKSGVERFLGWLLAWDRLEDLDSDDDDVDSGTDGESKPKAEDKERTEQAVSLFYSHGPRAFTGILFIPAIQLVFKVMACRLSPSPVDPSTLLLHAERFPDIPCWSASNPLQILLAVIGIIWLAVLYPLSLRAAVHMNEYDPAMRFLPRFLCYMIMFEFLVTFNTNVFIQYPAIVTPITLVALVSLACYNFYMQPALGGGTEFNHYRGAVLAGSAWGAVVPVVTLFLAPHQWWPIVVYAVLLPPIMIGAFRASRWRARQIEVNALDGLIQVDEEIKIEKLRRTTENIANLSLLEGNREKVMDMAALDRLVQLTISSDSVVSLHAARTFGNLSSDDRNRIAIAAVASKTLLDVVSTSENPFVIHHAARAVANLSANRECRKLLVDEGAVNKCMTVAMKKELPDHAIFMIMRTLLNLSLESSVKESFLDEYSPVTLLKMARDKSRDASIRRNALAVLYNLSVLPDNREYIVNQRGIELLYPLSVGVKTPIEVVSQAQKCIERLTNKNPDMKLRLSRVARKMGKVKIGSQNSQRVLKLTAAAAARARLAGQFASAETGSVMSEMGSDAGSPPSPRKGLDDEGDLEEEEGKVKFWHRFMKGNKPKPMHKLKNRTTVSASSIAMSTASPTDSNAVPPISSPLASHNHNDTIDGAGGVFRSSLPPTPIDTGIGVPRTRSLRRQKTIATTGGKGLIDSSGSGMSPLPSVAVTAEEPMPETKSRRKMSKSKTTVGDKEKEKESLHDYSATATTPKLEVKEDPGPRTRKSHLKLAHIVDLARSKTPTPSMLKGRKRSESPARASSPSSPSTPENQGEYSSAAQSNRRWNMLRAGLPAIGSVMSMSMPGAVNAEAAVDGSGVFVSAGSPEADKTKQSQVTPPLQGSIPSQHVSAKSDKSKGVFFADDEPDHDDSNPNPNTLSVTSAAASSKKKGKKMARMPSYAQPTTSQKRHTPKVRKSKSMRKLPV